MQITKTESLAIEFRLRTQDQKTNRGWPGIY